MNRRAVLATSVWIFSLLGCQSVPGAMELPGAPPANSVSFNDVTVEMESCEITPDRSAICRLGITNRYTDKGIEIWPDIRIQDDRGNEYAVTSGGFGDTIGRRGGGAFSQTAVADSTTPFTIVATNLSTRASSIRAVVFQRFLARGMDRQALGYRDKVVFRSPRMVASGAPATPPAGAVGGTTAPPPSAPPGPGAQRVALAEGWQDIGYWDYDGVDGQNLPRGLVYRPTPGQALGRSWPGYLELRNHADLRPRQRNLWPVRISPAERRICADYPGYPSYAVEVDLPGERQDGLYQVAQCKGGS